MPISFLELSMTIRSLAPALTLLLTAPALMAQAAPAPMRADIVETAAAAGSFKTLIAALDAAGLSDTLKGSGPFTVFAPTDAAFAKLPAGTVEGLLKDIPKLRAILTYHVVAGQIMAKDVVKLASAKTLQGQSLAINTKDGVKVDGARIVQADVMASNGVIHVIDSVVLPRS